MNILVTGIAGFIGYNVSKQLLEQGHQVIGIDNLNDYYDVSLKQYRLSLLEEYESLIFIKGDISEKLMCEQVFSSYAIDQVIHLAAQAGVRYSFLNPDAYIQSNITGFFNIMHACVSHNITHFIYASSSSVYGNNLGLNQLDSETSKPVSLYAATKKANEVLAYSYSEMHGLATTGLRFFTVYGPLGRPDMAYYKFTKNIIEGKPITVFEKGELLRDNTYISDIVNGILKAMDHIPKGDVPYQVFNLGNHKPITINALIKAIEKNTNKKAIIEYLPMQKGDVRHTYADISISKKVLGYNPKVSLNEGIAYFVKWYLSFFGDK